MRQNNTKTKRKMLDTHWLKTNTTLKKKWVHQSKIYNDKMKQKLTAQHLQDSNNFTPSYRSQARKERKWMFEMEIYIFFILA